jgi:hypothetical protein
LWWPKGLERMNIYLKMMQSWLGLIRKWLRIIRDEVVYSAQKRVRREAEEFARVEHSKK